MKTQAELDAEYQAWLGMVAAAVAIRNRIVAAGDMATKTRVEDELMPIFGIDRYDAHMIMNHIEHRNLR
jgi:hypothetical protein